MSAGVLTQRNSIAFQQLEPTVSQAMTTADAGRAFTTNASEIQLYNTGTSAAFVRFSTDGSAATVADYPVAPGAVVVITLDPNVTITAVHALLLSGTGTLYITPGQGQ